MPLEIYVIFEQCRGKFFDTAVKNIIRFDWPTSLYFAITHLEFSVTNISFGYQYQFWKKKEFWFEVRVSIPCAVSESITNADDSHLADLFSEFEKPAKWMSGLDKVLSKPSSCKATNGSVPRMRPQKTMPCVTACVTR